jgi:HAE1 family hydrophobic/amphiphilic exporter-1
MMKVDNDSTAKGISIENAMNTLSTLVGITKLVLLNTELIISNCSSVSRVPCIARGYLETLCENDRDEMVPYSAFEVRKVYGLSEITRHNMYTSTEISGSAAVGYSSGTAIKVIQEVAAEKLPRI